MALILFCVLGISPGNPGVVKKYVLTPNQIDHLAWITLRADTARDPASYEIAAKRAYEVRLCRDHTGRAPELVWVRR